MKGRRRSKTRMDEEIVEPVSPPHVKDSSPSSLEISETLLQSSSESSESRTPDSNPTDSDSTHRPVRPPISYATLITEAIESCPARQLVLSDIYEFIEEHYPYFRTAGQGWKVHLH
jgi:forkhead box protein F